MLFIKIASIFRARLFIKVLTWLRNTSIFLNIISAIFYFFHTFTDLKFIHMKDRLNLKFIDKLTIQFKFLDKNYFYGENYNPLKYKFKYQYYHFLLNSKYIIHLNINCYCNLFLIKFQNIKFN